MLGSIFMATDYVTSPYTNKGKVIFGIGCGFVTAAIRVLGNYAEGVTFAILLMNILVPYINDLTMMKDLDWSNFTQLLLGNHGGVIGEVCAAALLLGGIYLCVRKIIKPIIPLCFMGSVVLFSWLFGGEQPVLSLFAGGVMLGSIFMATDYVTSPYTDKGKVIFGIGCGFVTAAIRVFGNYAEGVTFAILLMNILVPYINELTMTKPLGGAAQK